MADFPHEPPESADTITVPPHRAPWDTAYEACNALADADSKLADRGKAKLKEFKDKKDKIEGLLKKRREARWRDEAETRQLILKGLRRKIRPKWGSFTTRGEPDSRCTSEGKPSYMLRYEGGTYEENEQVAKADKCVHAFYVSTSTPGGPNDNEFCCPKPPQ